MNSWNVSKKRFHGERENLSSDASARLLRDASHLNAYVTRKYIQLRIYICTFINTAVSSGRCTSGENFTIVRDVLAQFGDKKKNEKCTLMIKMFTGVDCGFINGDCSRFEWWLCDVCSSGYELECLNNNRVMYIWFIYDYNL